jgi:uncharacterized membrane protein
MLSKQKFAERLAALKGFCEKLHEHLPIIYLFYAIPAIVLLALITPPFQVPDEPNHFCRAEQVSTGRLVAVFYSRGEKQPRTIPDERVLMPDIGGFKVNKGIAIANSFYADIPSQTSSKVTKSMLVSSGKIGWNLGTEYGEFPNTAIYPPTGYIMSAFGIMIGKLLHLSVIDTLYLSRCLNGFLCAFLCFYAVRLAKASRLLLFNVLLFPMTLSLFASVSQDGILISLACIFFAIIGYVQTANKYYSWKHLITMIVAVAAISAARPPYFMLSFLFFFLSIDRRVKLACFLATLVPVALWGWLNRHNYAVVWAPPEMKINAALQIKHILDDPLEFGSLFFRYNFIYIREMVFEFIGVLGWLDVRFRSYFYLGGFISLVFAAAISTYFNLKEKSRLRAALIVLTIATFIAILIAQYITWVELEAPYLGGLQGRYFIPVFIPVAFALAGFRQNIPIRTWHVPLFLFVLIFPFISIVVSVCQLILRYYLVN